MWAYVANDVTGPYKRADKNALLLAKGHTYFSRFFPTPDGVLVNHHSMSGARLGKRPITYFASLKLSVLDKEGILRFKYWKGNESLKGEVAKVTPRTSSDIMMMTDSLDFGRGIVIEGSVRLPENKTDKPASLYINADNRNYAVQVLCDGSVEMGTVDESGRNWRRQHGVNRQWNFGETVSLRLLLRRGMLEAYLDDHFMECWMMGCHRAKKVTIAIPGQANNSPVQDLKVWQMTLPGWKELKSPTQNPKISQTSVF